MTILVSFLVVIIAVAAVTYAFVTAQHRQKAVASVPRTATNLQVGNIVRYRMLPENNFTVTGFIDYQENGYTWREARLVDGDTERWLGIAEEDCELELLLWREIELDTPITGGVPPEIPYAGISYREKESGQAHAVMTGQTGNRQEMECRYWDFADSTGKRLLSVERWGNEFEVSLGVRVRPEELDIFAP